MWQYNGLVLLSAYLERLHMQHEVMRLTGQAGLTGAPSLPPLLGTLAAALTAMGRRPLPASLLSQVQALLPQVEAWYQEALPRPRPETRPEWRVAAAAGAIYGEKQVNDGLIALGRLFAPLLAHRFQQQALFHQGRIRVVGAVVSALSRGAAPPRPELSYVERWYDELLLKREGVMADLKVIGRLLASPHQ